LFLSYTSCPLPGFHYSSLSVWNGLAREELWEETEGKYQNMICRAIPKSSESILQQERSSALSSGHFQKEKSPAQGAGATMMH